MLHLNVDKDNYCTVYTRYVFSIALFTPGMCFVTVSIIRPLSHFKFLLKVALKSQFSKVLLRKWAHSHWKGTFESCI